MRVSDVKITNARRAIYANAYPEKPIRNVVFENVSIQAGSGGSINHAQDWTMHNVTLRSNHQVGLKNSKDVKLPEWNNR